MFKILRSITRLAVGGAVTGYDVLTNKLQEWDEDPQSAKQVSAEAGSEENNSSELLRFAVIGWLLETQSRLESGARTTQKAIDWMGKTTDPITKPLKKSRVLAPLRNRFSVLVDRGEDEVNQWIDAGRIEHEQSQQLAQNAFYGTVDYWVHYFAENQEVVDLVTSQSVSFMEEIMEEIRERTVSADNYIEGLVRYILRRKPREDLPEPPPFVKTQAIHTRQGRNRLLVP